MRKIDAVLLSALILYDYSAQSLVDSDILGLGNSFVIERVGLQENNFPEAEQADPLFLTGNENVIQADNTELNPLISSVTAEKTISYHALAKINSAAETVAAESQYNSVDAVHISMPDPSAADMALSESFSSAIAEETASTLSVASVSSSFVALSSLENLEVKDQLNEGNMQFADTDADGMFNFEDKCPAVAGVARFEGCPVPDSDADGVNDEEDRCPFVVGSIANGGCAETGNIEGSLASNDFNNDQPAAADYLAVVKFEKEAGVLSNKDFNIILQLADQIMNNPGVKVDVVKSTDNNSTLQADTVLSYLRDLGVKDSQMSITTKDAGTNVLNGGVGLQLRH
ncbi:hypothetical protein [Agriterribacter sp.]|uniref:hypothetical protein n=1 Tax=Agriterribacter sp. TaxID=2821509 RepID=UPI002B69119E|nr:hypothetical protein [Agriterribacter sp.]HRP56627.1 hypothetical protein [Agriterribacter sp.]